MVDCKEIIEIMRRLAPEQTCEAWDNVGLIIGGEDAPVERILISLDYTEKTRAEAVERKCQMVITHHPPIFSKLARINGNTPLGRLIMDTIKSGISVYSAHTNLDYAAGGTDDTLFEALGLLEKEYLMPPNIHGQRLGRTGCFAKDFTLGEVCELVKEKLGVEAVKCVGNLDALVSKAATVAGSGASAEFFANTLAAGADVYITGDLKYHEALDAAAMGLNIIDATHFATENIVCKSIKNYLEENLEKGKNVEIILSETSEAPFKFI